MSGIGIADRVLDCTVVAGYTSVGYRIRERGWEQRDLPRMDGRVVLVTGATSGIGRAAAEGFASLGAAVRILARDRRRGELARDEIVAQSGNSDVAIELCDLSDVAAVRAFGARFSARAERLDVLVNNAGMGFAAPVSEMQTKWLDMQLAINLRAIALFYRECLPMLKVAGEEHRNALVVNTASIAGKRGTAGNAVYSATKHGVVGWTDSMNRELHSFGIKSTALCPGWVDTPMTDFVKEHIPAEEMMRPEDIAEAVRYLLRVSPACVIPEVMFNRPGDEL